LAIEPEGAAVVTAFWPTGKGVAARLWRPYPGEAEVRVRIAGARGVSRTNLLGGASERLSEGEAVSMHMAQGQVVTLAATVP
jgi:hypothetical protein